MNSRKVFEEQLNQKTLKVLNALKEVFPSDQPDSLMTESMAYSLFSPGKRIRAVLLTECAAVCKGSEKDALKLACAVEMIHAYSLIHDDLPCMDNDDMRRGLPSNHVKYGYAQALLSGDGLLNLAYETVFNGYENSPDKDSYMAAARFIARSAGYSGMIGGQSADIANCEKQISAETLEYINSHKTGALIKSCVAAGAILGRTDKTDKAEYEAFLLYGDALGEMFQLVDDVLDIKGESVATGKPSGSDEKNGKATYPAMFGMLSAEHRIEELYDICAAQCDIIGENAGFLKKLALYLKQREN